jgi:hypothetical protein
MDGVKILCEMVEIFTDNFVYFRLDLKFYLFFTSRVFVVFEKWYQLEDRPASS